MSRATFAASPTVTAGEAIAQYRAIKLTNDSGVVDAVFADADEAPVGIALHAAAIDEELSFRPILPGQEHVGIASKAIAVGDTVYTDDDGKFTDTDGGSYTERGIATSAAGGDGEEFGFIAF